MNIGVTGCSSAIGTKVCSIINNLGFNLIRIGRNEEVLWSFGHILPKLDLQLLIHIAHARDISPEAALRGNELLLKSLSKNAFVVYLSSTSAHLNTLSKYGRSKYLCETLFENAGAAIVKSGLIFDHSSKNQTGVLGTLEYLTGKLPVIPVPFGGNPILYMSDIEALGATLVHLSLNGRPGKYSGFSSHSLTLSELVIRLGQSSNREARVILLPDSITRNLAISFSRFNNRLGPFDSLLSLVEEISQDEIRSLIDPAIHFPKY